MECCEYSPWFGISGSLCGTTRDKRANSRTVRHLTAFWYWDQTSSLLGPAWQAWPNTGSFWKVLSRLSDPAWAATAAAWAFQYFNFFCCLFLFLGILQLLFRATSFLFEPELKQPPLRSICFQVTLWFDLTSPSPPLTRSFVSCKSLFYYITKQSREKVESYSSDALERGKEREIKYRATASTDRSKLTLHSKTSEWICPVRVRSLKFPSKNFLRCPLKVRPFDDVFLLRVKYSPTPRGRMFAFTPLPWFLSPESFFRILSSKFSVRIDSLVKFRSHKSE